MKNIINLKEKKTWNQYPKILPAVILEDVTTCTFFLYIFWIFNSLFEVLESSSPNVLDLQGQVEISLRPIFGFHTWSQLQCASVRALCFLPVKIRSKPICVWLSVRWWTTWNSSTCPAKQAF